MQLQPPSSIFPRQFLVRQILKLVTCIFCINIKDSVYALTSLFRDTFCFKIFSDIFMYDSRIKHFVVFKAIIDFTVHWPMNPSLKFPLKQFPLTKC